MNALITLLREIWPSLERFILGFISFNEGQLRERAKTIINASQEAQKANEVKKEVKDHVKKLSDADLSRLSVRDD